MAKQPTIKKGLLEKAADVLIRSEESFSFQDGTLLAGRVAFCEHDGSIVCHGIDKTLSLAPERDVGDVLQFVRRTVAAMDPCSAPETLGGNGKEFEELLMMEAKRLEKLGLLTMGRYGTQVSMVDNLWMPVPSYPDFDGVQAGGRQFIIEAKVCTQPSFRIQKDKLKHKQVRHMLTRGRFGVPCYLLIHFNARLGATFYDSPFTVSIPVKSADDGGWEVWEQFDECKEKDKEFPPLTRALAKELGSPVRWIIPTRSNKLRPDLLGMLNTGHQATP